MYRNPDFNQFLIVLRRSGKSSHIPYYEHIASPGFIAAKTNTRFGQMRYDAPGFWEIYVNFWLGMGFDCIPMEIPLTLPPRSSVEGASEGSEAHAVIHTIQDFEEFQWPTEEHPIEFRHFETVASLIPDGVKIVGGVCTGPYEWVSQLMGVMGLSYALVDNTELVELMFDKIGRLIIAADKQLATMDCIGALRQGDDLGFKTATFLSPDQLRKYVFPIYRQMVETAHNNDKPFILHSCSNLSEVYDDIIDYCDIDAKHSFEDAILPVGEFKKQYGHRVTPLGGLDVDFICRNSGDTLRKYVRKHIEECFSDGYWALGTGNSLTDYMPVENYLTVLDEAGRVCGS